MVDGWFLGDVFWKVEGSSAHTCESRAAHGWQLTCTVITIWWRGPPHVWPINMHGSSRVAINMHGNYYMVEGTPSHEAN